MAWKRGAGTFYDCSKVKIDYKRLVVRSRSRNHYKPEDVSCSKEIVQNARLGGKVQRKRSKVGIIKGNWGCNVILILCN